MCAIVLNDSGSFTHSAVLESISSRTKSFANRWLQTYITHTHTQTNTNTSNSHACQIKWKTNNTHTLDVLMKWTLLLLCIEYQIVSKFGRKSNRKRLKDDSHHALLKFFPRILKSIKSLFFSQLSNNTMHVWSRTKNKWKA